MMVFKAWSDVWTREILMKAVVGNGFWADVEAAL